jgi:hypothetical protein
MGEAREEADAWGTRTEQVTLTAGPAWKLIPNRVSVPIDVFVSWPHRGAQVVLPRQAQNLVFLGQPEREITRSQFPYSQQMSCADRKYNSPGSPESLDASQRSPVDYQPSPKTECHCRLHQHPGRLMSTRTSLHLNGEKNASAVVKIAL